MGAKLGGSAGEATEGTYHELQVKGPLGEPVWAKLGVLGDGETAVLKWRRPRDHLDTGEAQPAPDDNIRDGRTDPLGARLGLH